MAPPTSHKNERLYGGRGASERARDRKRRFLDAGIECFGTLGYSATTVRQICHEAGLTERYLYESFGNREQLFVAVAAECVTGLMGTLAMAKARQDHAPTEQINRMLDAFFRWFQDDPRRVRIQLLDPTLISPSTQEIYTEVTRAFVHFARDAASEWYELSTPDGALDGDLIATMLVGGLIEVVKEWARNGFDRPREEVVLNASVPFLALAGTLPRR